MNNKEKRKDQRGEKEREARKGKGFDDLHGGMFAVAR